MGLIFINDNPITDQASRLIASLATLLASEVLTEFAVALVAQIEQALSVDSVGADLQLILHRFLSPKSIFIGTFVSANDLWKS